MKDPDGVEHDFLCTIAEMEEKKEQGWRVVFSAPKHNLIGHTGDIISHTSSDWKDVLKNIRDKSPGSNIEI